MHAINKKDLTKDTYIKAVEYIEKALFIDMIIIFSIVEFFVNHRQLYQDYGLNIGKGMSKRGVPRHHRHAPPLPLATACVQYTKHATYFVRIQISLLSAIQF